MAMTLRLEPELDNDLGDVAELLGLSKQQVVAQAVAIFLEAQKNRLEMRRTVEMILQRDTELMKRLEDS
jgi:predicted transcriptional regulator